MTIYFYLAQFFVIKSRQNNLLISSNLYLNAMKNEKNVNRIRFTFSMVRSIPHMQNTRRIKNRKSYCLIVNWKRKFAIILTYLNMNDLWNSEVVLAIVCQMIYGTKNENKN